MFTIGRAGLLPAVLGLLILWTATAGAQTAAPQQGPAAAAPTALSTPARAGSSSPDFVSRLLSRAELYDPATGTFTQTGSLAVARRAFTATRLENGKVLITGGYSAADISLASTELYDPVTGKFSATGSMHLARGDHAATLLTDGRVLIAGGSNTYDPSSPRCEELYNPQTGKFTVTGVLTTTRDMAAAVLLRSGKVLIAGGCSDYNFNHLIEKADLYDPEQGSFTGTGAMIEPRQHPSAVLLRNGRVLIVGGDDIRTTPAELYDPKTGKFTAAHGFSSASTPSDCVAEPLQNGNVLITGCDYNVTGSGLNANAELYNPETGKFSKTGSMTTARSGNTATLLKNGKVLIAGGGGASANTPEAGDTLASAELYDPAAGAFTPTGSMTVSRTGHQAIRLQDGKVLIVGGVNVTTPPPAPTH